MATLTCAWGSARAGIAVRGLGTQALGLLLRFAFAELNLFRVTIVIPEYNQAALALVRKFGFLEEVRRRNAILCDERVWDLLVFGLLRSEWMEVNDDSSEYFANGHPM